MKKTDIIRKISGRKAFGFICNNTLNHFLNKAPYLFGEKFLSSPQQPIDLRLTLRCNLRCRQCHDWRSTGSFELSLEQWRGVILQLKAWMPGLYLRFYGGEPMVRPDFFELLSFCKDIGIPTALTSNGYFIDSEAAKKMQRLGLVQLTLSLDGYSKRSHDFLRGQDGAFERVMRAIEVSSGRISVRVNTTLMEQNLDEIDDLLGFALSRGVQLSFGGLFNPLAPPDWASEWKEYKNIWPKDSAKIASVIESIISFKQKHPFLIANSIKHLNFLKSYYADPSKQQAAERCQIRFSRMTIYESGDVYICCFRSPIGNILKSSPKDIWYSLSARDARSVMSSCRLPCHCLRGYFQESILDKMKKFGHDFLG